MPSYTSHVWKSYRCPSGHSRAKEEKCKRLRTCLSTKKWSIWATSWRNCSGRSPSRKYQRCRYWRWKLTMRRRSLKSSAPASKTCRPMCKRASKLCLRSRSRAWLWALVHPRKADIRTVKVLAWLQCKWLAKLREPILNAALLTSLSQKCRRRSPQNWLSKSANSTYNKRWMSRRSRARRSLERD